MQRQRTLKIVKGTRITGTACAYRRVKTFPKVQLQGDWLKKAGFVIGEFVEIVVSEQMLYIIKKGGNA
jgi:hypothetical protein